MNVPVMIYLSFFLAFWITVDHENNKRDRMIKLSNKKILAYKNLQKK